jgi:hypothetical protein
MHRNQLISLGILVTFVAAIPFLTNPGEYEVSRKSSPDGRHTVFEFQSNDEGPATHPMEHR